MAVGGAGGSGGVGDAGDAEVGLGVAVLGRRGDRPRDRRAAGGGAVPVEGGRPVADELLVERVLRAARAAAGDGPEGETGDFAERPGNASDLTY